MNNYVVARNAVIASTLVMLLMLSLQPQRVSSVLLNLAHTITSQISDSREVNAADESAQTSFISAKLNSVTISVPEMEGYSMESHQDAAILRSADQTQLVFTVEQYEDAIKEKALSLAHELQKNEALKGVSVNPVLHGNHLYYEVSTKNQIRYAVLRINSDEIITILPSPDTDSEFLNTVLSELRFN